MHNVGSGHALIKRLKSASHYALTATAFCTIMKEKGKNMSELPDHFVIANKIVNRAERGLPQDRWMRGDHEMTALVKAYIELQNACINMHADMIQKGSDAMDIG